MRVIFIYILYCYKNLGKVVGEEREFNRVLMNLVKNCDVFTQKWQNLIFDVFI